MPRRKEISWDPALFPTVFARKHGELDRNKRPLAALMEAAPGHEPEPTADELLPLREAIQDALEDLDERERFVFDALYVERLSLRHLGRVLSLSKTQVARVRDEATAKLRERLQGHPLVQAHLTDGVE